VIAPYRYPPPWGGPLPEVALLVALLVTVALLARCAS
jgi:hypothetical protein